MSFARLAAISVAVSVLWAAAASAGGPLRPFKEGFWSGGAYIDDRSGAFTHCSAGVAYDSGINLFILVSDQYRWWLGFINPKWSFTPHLKMPIALRLDGRAPLDQLAIVPNGQLLLVPLPNDARLINEFRRSSELSLDAEGQSFLFKLNDTLAVSDRLTSCVRTSLALAAKAPPVELSTAAKAGEGSAPAAAKSQAASVSRSPAAPPEAAAAGSSPPSAEAPPAPAKTVLSAAQNSAPITDGEPLRPVTRSGEAVPAAKSGPLPNLAAASTGSPGPLSSAAPAQPATPAAPPQPEAVLRPAADGAPQGSRGSSTSTSSGDQQPPSMPQKPDAAVPTTALSSGQPPLAFTAVAPMMPLSPALGLAPEPATPTALEEVRLAMDFLNRAGLPDAHLVAADKPPALADFAAVWRSEDAAGAVKIVPPGPDVSALGIASNLITVDPQLCKGDFTAARYRTDIGHRAVFSAVLSCNQADGRRVTEYFIAPRHHGGFVVFAVIRNKGGGEILDLNRQQLDELSRAAIEAVEGEG
jgi:hypothetical protein